MMSFTPTLSICVPSRNRQVWFQETIRALTSSLRTDVEFVFVDNSDDPAIMNAFIEPWFADPRVKYVPTGSVIRPMMDNWETAFDSTTGRWVVFIGDDDHVDPELAGLIIKLEEKIPDVEALDWTKLYYTWPYEGKPVISNPVHLNSEIHEVPKSALMERAFRWEHARDVLGCGFGIYHGAVKRELMERVRALTDRDRWFEHPIIDYDNIFKVIMYGKRFAHCRRPLSVMGVCPASNSAALGNPDAQRAKQESFDKEHKTPVDQMPCYEDFPFHSRLGLVSCILMVQHWFAERYGHHFSGYEERFVKSCAIECSNIRDRAKYEMVTEGYRKAISTWKNGRWLKAFKPTFQEVEPSQTFSGLLQDSIFLTDDHEGFATVKSFYDVASAMLVPITELSVEPERYLVADIPRKRA
jgi:glycosyltransferase involved in cell wall biosynthesis